MQAFYDASILFHIATTLVGLAMLWRLIDKVGDLVTTLKKLREGQEQEIEAMHGIARRK